MPAPAPSYTFPFAHPPSAHPHPPHPQQVLATDPNFIRLSKGAYSLHCFHADKEQLVRVQPPKEPKSGKKAAAAAAAAAAAGGEGGEGGATPAAAKKEKEAVPMQRVEAKSWEVGAGRGSVGGREEVWEVGRRPPPPSGCRPLLWPAALSLSCKARRCCLPDWSLTLWHRIPPSTFFCRRWSGSTGRAR